MGWECSETEVRSVIEDTEDKCLSWGSRPYDGRWAMTGGEGSLAKRALCRYKAAAICKFQYTRCVLSVDVRPTMMVGGGATSKGSRGRKSGETRIIGLPTREMSTKRAVVVSMGSFRT